MKIKFLFALLVSIVCIVGCAAEDENEVSNDRLSNLNKTSEMPIVKESIELDFFAEKAAGNGDYNDILINNEYEKKTNIKINWEEVPVSGVDEKRNLALSSDSLPDVFYANMPNQDLLKYGESGTFIKLNELIEEHAPNLNKILEENPDIKKGITMPDGNIYAFPRLYEPEFTSLLIGARPFIREDWLEQLGMNNPTTTDELYDFLKAVKETDLNGNGEHDEIPFGATTIEHLRSWLKGSFGLANHGRKNKYIDKNPKNDALRFFPISNEYKEMLEYIHKLYDEKLIQENIYSIDSSQYLATAADGLYGSTYYYSPDTLFGEVGQSYVGGEALEGPHGDRFFAHVNHPVAQIGSFTITKENEHPEATVRWMDYFYGEEGAKLFFMGIEGETYEEKEDGTYEYLDHIKNSKDGLTIEQEVAKYLTYPGGGYPGHIMEAYFNGAENTEMSQEASGRIAPYIPETVWPEFTLTAEENKIMSSVGRDIDKFVTEMSDKFIVGDEPFSKWDEYVEEIEKMGLDKYMTIQKDAYDRYLNVE